MTCHEILGKLRNGHGFTFDEMREVRLAAADHIESLEQMVESLREHARKAGLDTAAYWPAKPLPEVKQELLRRVDRLATFAYAYWTACEVGQERTWGANLYEILRTAPREARR
jgi:hypothetical protein